VQEKCKIIFFRHFSLKNILLNTSKKGCEKIAVSKRNNGENIRNKHASLSGNIFWRHTYEALCIILLCLTAGQLFLGLSNPISGMDYRVYKGAVQALNHGEDPYFLLNVNQYSGEWLPFLYPPHTLLFFWCLQIFFIFQNIWMYYIFLFALLVASGYLIITLDQKPQYLFLITLLMTGFISTFYNFYDGNKDMIFLFLFACIFRLMIKEKFLQSSIIMGLMGSFSLITIPFIALYLAVRRSMMDRLTYILLSIGVVAAIFLITLWVNPSLLISYSETLMKNTSPLYDKFGWATPTPFLMFSVLLNQKDTGITIPQLFVSLVYSCLIFGASWYVIKKNQVKPLIVYSFVMLAIFMVLPRIKPYDFIILVLPLYFLIKEYSYQIKILVITVISLVPLFFWYYPYIVRFYPEIYPTRSLIFSISDYVYTVCLFLIFVITFIIEYYKPIITPDSQVQF
jgi:hypothetical protein